MNTRLERLIELNDRTDDLVEFMDREAFKSRYGVYPEDAMPAEDQVQSQRRVIGATAAGAGLVGAGYLGQRAVNNAGGYGAVAKNVRTRVQPVVTAARDRITAAGPRVAAAAKSVPATVANLLAKLAKAKKGRFGFESREQRLIQLHSAADKLLQLEAR